MLGNSFWTLDAKFIHVICLDIISPPFSFLVFYVPLLPVLPCSSVPLPALPFSTSVCIIPVLPFPSLPLSTTIKYCFLLFPALPCPSLPLPFPVLIHPCLLCSTPCCSSLPSPSFINSHQYTFLSHLPLPLPFPSLASSRSIFPSTSATIKY